jgi:TldD protein
MKFEHAAARALDTATARGASYADVRFDDQRSERIEVRNGVVVSLSDDRSIGYGLRAFVDGAWGFAASDDSSDRGLDATAARAVEIAKAGAAVARLRFAEAPSERYVDRFVTPVARYARSAARRTGCALAGGRARTPRHAARDRRPGLGRPLAHR